MTSPDDVIAAARFDRRARRLYRELDGGLEAALTGQGAHLKGLSLKVGADDYLVTLRADFEGKAMICFVGASTAGNCFLKAAREARANKLRWKVDKWAKA